MEALSFLGEQFVLFFADWGIDITPILSNGGMILGFFVVLLVGFFAISRI